MAIAIKTVPVLENKEAKSFQESANQNFKIRESIDFKDEVDSTNKILTKAKLR